MKISRFYEFALPRPKATRQQTTAPKFDETCSFGGLPTGKGGTFAASEIPEVVAEFKEGRARASQRLNDEAKK